MIGDAPVTVMKALLEVSPTEVTVPVFVGVTHEALTAPTVTFVKVRTCPSVPTLVG